MILQAYSFTRVSLKEVIQDSHAYSLTRSLFAIRFEFTFGGKDENNN
jgi:hypothetical protein